MKDSRYDRVLGKIESRLSRVKAKISAEFKQTKPFDKEPVDPKQRLYDFDNMPAQQKNFARIHFPEEFALYEQEIEQIRSRYNA